MLLSSCFSLAPVVPETVHCASLLLATGAALPFLSLREVDRLRLDRGLWLIIVSTEKNGVAPFAHTEINAEIRKRVLLPVNLTGEQLAK